MKNILIYILFLPMFYAFPAYAQDTLVNQLGEVFLTDAKLVEFSTGQTVISINDSVTKQDRPLLTSVLNFNSSVYFKENGHGMVSSPSFRGTSASHTAVLWNGININSQFNGQTNFNTINTAGFDEIAVRGGGGSVIYGTGAIGGTVHLNNLISFKEKLEQDIFLQYGDFNTLDARYKLKMAKGDWSFSISGARNHSDNDYEYPEDEGTNINGEFYNNTINVALAFRLDHANLLKFYSGLYESEYHFSLMRPSETKTKHQDLNSRNLLEWESKINRFTSTAKLAFLDERYKYFGNIASENYSFGEAKNFIAKYDLKYSIPQKLQLNTVLSNNYTKGEGSNLGNNNRNIFSAALLMKHQPFQKFSYEAGLRKEVTNNYESPVLFSAAASYEFSGYYALKLNASRNFRIPTYNDLYWTSSGNTSLNPETSLQAEVGNRFTWNSLELNLTAFYNDITNMIRWVPEGNGLWRPQNEDEVQTYGVESILNWQKQLGGFGSINLSGTYAYTISKNKQTSYQLIYVPYHKATAAISYRYNRWSTDYQFLYTGEVFTRSDNNPKYNLDDYAVSNLGIAYSMGKKENYRVGAKVLNIFDEAYESVENRWMPGRNFNIYLNLNF